MCGSTKEFCSCVHMYEFKVNELVEFILVDEATMSESHPVIKWIIFVTTKAYIL